MFGYNKNNAKHTVYGNSIRLRILAFMGWVLNVQFKVCGIPFGGCYKGTGCSETACTGTTVKVTRCQDENAQG